MIWYVDLVLIPKNEHEFEYEFIRINNAVGK